MQTIKYLIKNAFSYIKAFLKWALIGILVGTIGGLIGSFFHISIDFATELRTENSFLIYFLPIGGIIIALIYKVFKNKGKIDTNRVIESVTTEEKVPFVMAPLIFISTVITHLLGGSAGREGAALQLGGSIGYNVGRVFKLKKEDLHIIVMSGMSAVFSALFGTPITAAFFAIEVVTVGVMHYMSFVPCIISAIAAYKIALMFKISPVKFSVTVPYASALMLLKVAVLVVLCALVSMLFCFAIKKCDQYMEKYIKNDYVRAFAGGIIIVLGTALLQTHDYNGAGMDVIIRAMSGSAKPQAFIIKIIFTAITIAAGFKGGEIVPAFFVGSTFGCVVGNILGINAGFSAAIGFVALFCGVVNCPVASLMLALEVFGSDAILIFAIVCGISYMMSGYLGLYKSQKIVYSKLDEHYIDINTK